MIKNCTNRILDRTGAPAYTWLLCLQYGCFLLNHMYNSTLNGVPLTLLLGVTVDISVLLRFHFWQPVYFKLAESSFPSESKEVLGHVVGISEHCGQALTKRSSLLTLKSSSIGHYCVLLHRMRPMLAATRTRTYSLLFGPGHGKYVLAERFWRTLLDFLCFRVGNRQKKPARASYSKYTKNSIFGITKSSKMTTTTIQL
jgi:hypothetical protein